MSTINAQNAFDIAVKCLDEVDISQETEDIFTAINLAANKGYFVAISFPMEVKKGEKLSLLLDKLGYAATTQNANMVKDGDHQAYVLVNWKFFNTNIRERLN
jgi:hypothetical protein